MGNEYRTHIFIDFLRGLQGMKGENIRKIFGFHSSYVVHRNKYNVYKAAMSARDQSKLKRDDSKHLYLGVVAMVTITF